ncbi:MAG: M24 family metallopeptidase [Bacteroidota bacterium]|nr:M24 family metallopeptidase [Bacteroidota bacterium]
MSSVKTKLIEAEEKALTLFETIKGKGLIVAGKSEHTLNTEVFTLAFELFGIKKYWHKRIVRAGKNTLCPYKENPPDLILQNDDILFFDFGPVFENWEADIGKTYVIGNDSAKLKLQKDVELAWQEGRDFYLQNKETLTGAAFYAHTKSIAEKYGWHYGNIHCGHLIGNFPHEKIIGDETINYIHPDNDMLMSAKDKHGNERFWIYEIHFVDTKKEIGGFFEQFLN